MFSSPRVKISILVNGKARKLKVEPEALKEQKFTVFGMRACDVQGVKVLDQVFLADPVDSFLCSEKKAWNYGGDCLSRAGGKLFLQGIWY